MSPEKLARSSRLLPCIPRLLSSYSFLDMSMHRYLPRLLKPSAGTATSLKTLSKYRSAHVRTSLSTAWMMVRWNKSWCLALSKHQKSASSSWGTVALLSNFLSSPDNLSSLLLVKELVGLSAMSPLPQTRNLFAGMISQYIFDFKFCGRDDQTLAHGVRYQMRQGRYLQLLRKFFSVYYAWNHVCWLQEVVICTALPTFLRPRWQPSAQKASPLTILSPELRLQQIVAPVISLSLSTKLSVVQWTVSTLRLWPSRNS